MPTKRSIDRVRRFLETANTSVLQDFLATVSAENELRAVRELKLLLKPRDMQATKRLARQFRSAVDRVIDDDSERQHARRYADFVELYAAISVDFAAKAKALLPVFQPLSLVDLIEISESILDSLLQHQAIHFRQEINAINSSDAPIQEKSDASEFELQNFQGRAKDCIFAYARALNAASGSINTSQRRCGNRKAIKTAKDTFAKIYVIANRWNSLDYALDKVTYGEWVVAEIADSDIPVVKFNETDPQVAKARLLGLRRQLVQVMLIDAKHERFIGALLNQESIRAMHHAEEHYCSQFGPVDLEVTDYQHFCENLKIELSEVDADDDLLVASDCNFIAHYLSGRLLRTYRDVAVALMANLSKERRHRFPRFTLQIQDIVKNVPGDENARAILEDALNSHVLTLPVRNYLDILDRPFVRGSDNKVYALPNSGTTWLGPLRQRLVGGGAQVKRFGRIWEDFVAKTLEDYGWAIIGRGVKLKKHGQTITDIDLLAFRQGLLLVVQVKAFAQSGVNIYSQWKVRCGIEKGVEQARVAALELRKDAEKTQCLLAAKKCVASITRIQPLVLTNAPFVGGWQCNEIPVVSLSDLMSALRGALVKFGNRRRILEEIRLCEGDKPSNEEFLDLLIRPVSFQIAGEIDVLEYISIELGPIEMRFPVHMRHDGRCRKG